MVLNLNFLHLGKEVYPYMETLVLYTQIALITVGVAILFFAFKLFFFQRKNTFISRHAYNIAYNNAKHLPDMSRSPQYTFGIASVLKNNYSFSKTLFRKLTGKKGLRVSSTIIQSRPLSTN